MNRPASKYFEECAGRLAEGGFDQITEEFERRRILPLLEEARLVVRTVLYEVARQAASNTAVLALTNVDLTHAVIPSSRPESQSPPSPL